MVNSSENNRSMSLSSVTVLPIIYYMYKARRAEAIFHRNASIDACELIYFT